MTHFCSPFSQVYLNLVPLQKSIDKKSGLHFCSAPNQVLSYLTRGVGHWHFSSWFEKTEFLFSTAKRSEASFLPPVPYIRWKTPPQSWKLRLLRPHHPYPSFLRGQRKAHFIEITLPPLALSKRSESKPKDKKKKKNRHLRTVRQFQKF